MNERFEYLVFKYLDKNLDKAELDELEAQLTEEAGLNRIIAGNLLKITLPKA